MLFTLQRYEFFSKSQLQREYRDSNYRCCLPYKGTNFSANHNPHRQGIEEGGDVVYPTKVRIFQQITTMIDKYGINLTMLFTLQRYEFFSKSQLSAAAAPSWSGCCLPYKGTNFSANHNEYLPTVWRVADVVYPTKVRIFQQITTQMVIQKHHTLMLFTLQRYEFFSKSQRMSGAATMISRCCLPYKGTNFSANHNSYYCFVSAKVMLFTLQRYEFFSKSQRIRLSVCLSL